MNDTSTLKPGDIVRHPTRLLNGLVVHGDGESIRVLHLTSLGIVTTTSDLTGWERAQVVKPGHVQVRVDDLDRNPGIGNIDGTTIVQAGYRVARALAAQTRDEQTDIAARFTPGPNAETPPTDDEQTTGATRTTTVPCPWCDGSVNMDLHFTRTHRRDVTSHVSADGGHTCPPVQPDEPRGFAARVTVTRPDGSVEKWVRCSTTSTRAWAMEGGRLYGISPETKWEHVCDRGQVVVIDTGWGDKG